ncbi:hypothetical protein AB0J83_22970 [Actinoplanes sp. NPDC049596]|uniref:hypothetical protein n=1 Tax=unclassified Actinoplanes TaxID=2626549 RepID=UPI00343E0EE2
MAKLSVRVFMTVTGAPVSFTANHDQIHSFATTIGGLTDDADEAVNYTREHLGIGYADGRMFATVVDTATTVREALVANYTAPAKLADASEQGIVKTANQYGDTDQAAAGPCRRQLLTTSRDGDTFP